MPNNNNQLGSSIQPTASSSSGALHDPLLEALIKIAQLENKPCSHTSLVAGLPLVNNKLTPELLVRAAARAEIASTIVERKLREISELVLPAILLLKDNNALVLLKLDKLKNKALVYLPLAAEEEELELAVLEQQYSGFAVFTRPVDKFETRAHQQEGQKQQHWFWSTISQSWRIYRDVLIASFLINMFALANPLFVMNVYDRVVPNNAIETLWALAVGIFVVFSFDYLLKLLRVYFIEIAGKKSDILLSAYIFERVLGAKFAQHPASVGSFVSRLRDFEAIRNFVTSATITAFVDLPFVLLFLLAVVYIGGHLVWIPVTIIPFILLYSFVAQRFLQQAVMNGFTASAQKSATLVEAMTNLETLKVLNAEGKVLRKWEKAVAMLAYWGLKSRMWSNGSTSFALFMQQLAGVLIVIAGVYAISQNDLTLGGLIACVLLSARIIAPLSQVAGLLVQYQQAKIALDSLEQIVSQVQERPEGKAFIKREKFNGSIEFADVDFSYPGEETRALDGVSFKIAAGEKVAIIGKLGSGKSTVHKLIANLYLPDEGSVRIDDVDIKQIDTADLRDALAYVPQECTLFYGSLRENIAFKMTSASDAEILRAAEIAGVNAFVNAHPHGFERMISERGENLSGGQKQAVAIARALINDPPMVLLDEPSAAMDSSSELRLIENLKTYLVDKTLVLVTHKTTLLALVDRVIVLDKGRVVADGAKEKVLDALKKGQIRVS